MLNPRSPKRLLGTAYLILAIMLKTIGSLLFVLSSTSFANPIAPRASGWSFNLKGDSGIVALESIIVSPTLALFFNKALDDPLQINNHSAWGALWNLETNTVTPLDLQTNSFCASGALLSNGTMVCHLSRLHYMAHTDTCV